MQNIYEIFNIARGTRLTKKDQKAGNIPFITAGTKNDGLKQKISNEGLTEYKNCITIDMFGFVKYRNYTFFCDDNIITLTPKSNYLDNEMVYFALCLAQQTKGKYDYGRQCRLKNITDYVVPSPDEIPSWVYEMEIPTFDDIAEAKTAEKVKLPPVGEWKSFRYDELFDIKKATGPKISEVKKTEGTVPYISATAENNGVAHYGDFIPTMKGNCITVGHLGDCFYQEKDFSGSNVTALVPKFGLTKERAMFLITLLNANKFKYNYGRVIGIARLKGEQISLPIDETGAPNWQLMEDYINSLPYSRYL